MGASTMKRILLVAALISSVANALPVQLVVNQRAKECLFEKLDKDESITMSVFILAGPELKATLEFTGPVAPATVNSGKELNDALSKFDHGEVSFHAQVDLEHLSLGDRGDEEDASASDLDGKSDAELTADERRQKRSLERKKALEARHRKEQQRMHQKKKVREEGEPFKHTIKAPTAGWYRFCIVGTWYQVTAEIDLRKESEYGGFGEDGHVLTFEEKVMVEEDKIMAAATASEEGIKDEDFQSTREKLKTLRRLLADIQAKQQQERHRLIVHAATNEHSHSRMVLSSLLQTVLFMAVTGFQIYTIRKWFKGAPVLGR